MIGALVACLALRRPCVFAWTHAMIYKRYECLRDAPQVLAKASGSTRKCLAR